MIDRSFIYIVDDDDTVRASLAFFLATAGFETRSYSGGRELLAEIGQLRPGCILLDIRMPAFDGFDVLAAIGSRLTTMPTIVMTGHGDVATAVQAMKLGASDFIEKPFEEDALLETLTRVFALLANLEHGVTLQEQARIMLSRLTHREEDVLRGLVKGRSNKLLAFELGLSIRTVEMHRASMMERLGVRTLPDALRLAFQAGGMTTPTAEPTSIPPPVPSAASIAFPTCS